MKFKVGDKILYRKSFMYEITDIKNNSYYLKFEDGFNHGPFSQYTIEDGCVLIKEPNDILKEIL